MSFQRIGYCGRPRLPILLWDIESEPELTHTLRQELGGAFRILLPGRELSRGRWELSEEKPAAVIIADRAGSPKDIEAWLRRLSEELPGTPVVLATTNKAPEDVLDLLELGIDDFITIPIRACDVLPRLWHLLEDRPTSLGDQAAKSGFVDQLNEKLGARQLIGQSPAFLEMIEKLPIISRCDANVLIRGETGTGKEVCARAIHYLGSRADAPFIPVNCGAIPVDLMENELFGHEREAFTGAGHARKGLIHAAANGTLFLDEIDELSLGAQVKLLRFLQEKEYRPLGSPKTQTSEARVIAATNTDMDEAVAEGRLRQDLYYRLNVLPLELPPLRERREDIPLLARHFAVAVSGELDRRPVPRFCTAVLQALQDYPWPGNVRELRHVVERAIILADGRTVIDCRDVALELAEEVPEPFKQAKARVVRRFERSYIGRLLAVYEGNISRAARAAGKNRRAFFELIRKHQIDAEAYRAG